MLQVCYRRLIDQIDSNSSMPCSVPATISSVCGCTVTDVTADVTGMVTAEGNEGDCQSELDSLDDIDIICSWSQPAHVNPHSDQEIQIFLPTPMY